MKTLLASSVGALVLCTAVLIYLPCGASAQGTEGRPVVAVFDIRTEGFSLPRTTWSLLNGYLASRLTSTGKYSVSPGSSIRKAMIDLKIGSQQDCYDDVCRVELGRAAAAHKYVSTLIWKVGGACSITIDLYDLRSETMDSSIEIAGVDCVEASIKEAISEGVNRLSEKNSKPRPISSHVVADSGSANTRPKTGASPAAGGNRFLHDIAAGKLRIEWAGMNMGAGFMSGSWAYGLLDLHLFTLNGRNWYYSLLESGVFMFIGHVGLGGRAGYQYILKNDWVIRIGGKLGWTMWFENADDGTGLIHAAEIVPHVQFVKFFKHGSVGVGIDVPIWLGGFVSKDDQPVDKPDMYSGGIYVYMRWSAF